MLFWWLLCRTQRIGQKGIGEIQKHRFFVNDQWEWDSITDGNYLLRFIERGIAVKREFSVESSVVQLVIFTSQFIYKKNTCKNWLGKYPVMLLNFQPWINSLSYDTFCSLQILALDSVIFALILDSMFIFFLLFIWHSCSPSGPWGFEWWWCHKFWRCPWPR